MNRELKNSLRPLIALGAFFIPLTVFGFYQYVNSEFGSYRLYAALSFLIPYAVLMLSIYSKQVIVSEAGITIISFFVSKHFISFTEIDHSTVRFLAERDWPISICFYKKGKRNPIHRIGLKSICKADANWLCSLPELRVVIRPGLTKQA